VLVGGKMALSDWDPITTIGFFLLFLLIMSSYGGTNPADTIFVQAAAVFLELPFAILGSLMSNFPLLLPIAFLGAMLYFKVAGDFLGEGILAWIIVAWFIIALAGWGVI